MLNYISLLVIVLRFIWVKVFNGGNIISYGFSINSISTICSCARCWWRWFWYHMQKQEEKQNDQKDD
jgi:hypothetical protein